MAKKTKMTKMEIVDKIVETLNIWTMPITATIALWWGIDASVYVLAIVGAINAILDCIKVFIKE